VAIGNDGQVVRQLRTLFQTGVVGALTDGQLLERFATTRGEAAERAFAVLLERHGPMVLGVCRGVLTDAHAADDAFQATFLVLVKKARGLWVRESLGPWLHQVAYRTASCARSAAVRQRRHEQRAAATRAAGWEARPEPADELGRVLHEEIERLPERYQAPLVLCDLEGRTHEQAARHLGWPVGTVKSRLARGRKRLRDRIRRRGFDPGAGLVAAVPPTGHADAVRLLALTDSTAKTAVQWATVGTTGPACAAAALLAQGVLRAMSMSHCWKLAAVLLVSGATASGVVVLARKGAADVALPAAEPANTNEHAARGADPQVVAVTPGWLRVTVAERGVVEATENPEIASQVAGQTTIVSIQPEDTPVKKGDIVCELDSSSLRAALRNQRIGTLEAEAAYKNAKAVREVAEIAVQEYVEGVARSERAALQGDVATAQSALGQAAARLDRTKQALKRVRDANALKGNASGAAEILAELDLEDRVDDAGQALTRTKAAHELARSKLDLLEHYTRDKTVRQLQSQVEHATSHELAKKQIWEIEQDKERALEKQIQYCSIVAPNEGYVNYVGGDNPVTGRPFLEPGSVVAERQKLFRLTNIRGPMRVNTKVKEAIVDRLAPGQTAQIKVDAFPDRVFSGAVETVYPRPDAKIRAQAGLKLYETLVRIDHGPPPAPPGHDGSCRDLDRRARPRAQRPD
jgi:RNA polymerase sigma factor (sigma-70 family)